MAWLYSDESLVREITSRTADILEDGGSLYGLADTAVIASLKAQGAWQWEFSPSRRAAVIKGVRSALANDRIANGLAEVSSVETGMGRREDTARKILLAIERTPGPEFLLADAAAKGLDVLSPFGVIASFIPSRDAAATALNNAVNMISGGNSVVFAPHPVAAITTAVAARMLDRALVSQGAPGGLVSAISAQGAASIKKLMNHESVSLLCVTGGKSAVLAALRSGKPAVAGGPGNPPAVADGTADLRKAARSLVEGCSFDNNTSCLGVKALFVVHSEADELARYMVAEGAVPLSDPADVRRLTGALLKGGAPDRSMTGKSAPHILRAAGLRAFDKARLILAETGETHPLVQEEIAAPVLPMVRVADFADGLLSAVRTEGARHHSATIYSTDANNMSVMARAMETSIFTKNAPPFSAIDYNGDCPTAFTIATTTGQGPVTPLTFCRIRKRARDCG
jgi:propionaldehyde dehydrogenase